MSSTSLRFAKLCPANAISVYLAEQIQENTSNASEGCLFMSHTMHVATAAASEAQQGYRASAQVAKYFIHNVQELCAYLLILHASSKCLPVAPLLLLRSLPAASIDPLNSVGRGLLL